MDMSLSNFQEPLLLMSVIAWTHTTPAGGHALDNDQVGKHMHVNDMTNEFCVLSGTAKAFIKSKRRDSLEGSWYEIRHFSTSDMPILISASSQSINQQLSVKLDPLVQSKQQL